MKSENKNFLLNVAYQMLTYIFPLITVSYISKRLGVDNVGIYSYTYSIVYMFMLVGMLGINNYGNREIAKVRDNREELSRVFWSIYRLQLMVVGIAIVGYLSYLFLWCKAYKEIAAIQFLYLVSVCFDINWFYFGLEKFKLTITRNCIIKVLSLVLILCFVKTEGDLAVYTYIMAGSTVASQLYLIFSLHKYVNRVKTTLQDSLKRLKGCLLLFVPVLAFGIYRVMDKTMLGSLSTVTELGYYENAERLINIPISVINALGTVMLPRMAYLLEHKTSEDSKKMIYTSMKLALLLASVMAMGLYLIADDVSVVLFGEQFLKSGSIIKILSVTILASAWANVIRTQYLIPMRMDHIYVKSTVGGAIVNLILNTLLIGKYGSYGACVGTIVAEYFVILYQTICVRNELDIDEYAKMLLKDLLSVGIIMAIAYCVGCFFTTVVARLIVNILVSVLLFIVFHHEYILCEFLGKSGNSGKMNK